jgi:hypothetical protein
MEDLYFFKSRYGNPYIVKGSWPDDIRQMWVDAMALDGIKAASAGIVPVYELGNTITSPDPSNPGQQVTQKLNAKKFASETTAQELLERFDADYIAVVPYGGADNIVNFSDAKERWLVWATKFGKPTAINAGTIAQYFTNNPELEFPNVAENLAWQGIFSGIGQQLPAGAVKEPAKVNT